MIFNPLDIIGKKYGNLFVQQFTESHPKNPYKTGRIEYFYICQCKCGKLHKAKRNNLITGHTKSCGCLRKICGKNNKSWTGFKEISGRTWYQIMQGAKERNIQFTISIKEAWEQYKKQNKKCAYTGLLLDMNAFKDSYNFKTASLDRINSLKGYESGNIQWVHKEINFMKGNLSSAEFVKLCRSVHDWKFMTGTD